MAKLTTTHAMEGMRVLGGKNGTKRIGKVRRTVFHPTEKRVVGFIVKRPDFLWMFHRKDMFVAIDGFDLEDGRMVVHQDAAATDGAACKALGVDYDQCLLWSGLPVMTAEGESFGVVGNIEFNERTGMVESFTIDAGAANNAILGTRTIPASYICGFRRGMGTALKTPDVDPEGVELGAMLVTGDVRTLAAEGGVAEMAGKATAVAVDKVSEKVDKAKEVGGDVARKTGEAVNKGAYATGRQLKKSKTMFSDFKKEYDKAVAPDKEPSGREGSLATSGQGKKAVAGKGASASASATSGAGAKPKPKSTAKAKPQAKPKNMFSAFKEEYDKARRD